MQKVVPDSPRAFKLFMEGALALAKVEANGIRIDIPYLERVTVQVTNQIEELERQLRADDVYKIWRRRFGMKANLDSGPQLAHVVFQELKHKSKTVTATGRDSTNEAAFAGIKLPFLKPYFRWKKLCKLRGTYLKGITQEVCNGRLHPSFNLNTVITFRSSSSSPNFTNIPIRNKEISKYIRTAFIPDGPDWVIVENDFRGAEVRVSACYHHDPTLVDYLVNPDSDMHRDAALDNFLITREEWNQIAKEDAGPLRNLCKGAFVFAQFYGSVYFQCAPSLWRTSRYLRGPNKIPMRRWLAAKGITKLGACNPKHAPAVGTFEAQVKSAEDELWQNRFPVYTLWKEQWWQAYRRKGWFAMHTGFKCSGIYKRNEVLNYVIQGASFHCLLQVLVWLQQWIEKHKMRAKIVGQIHDSIISSVPRSELQDYLNAVRHFVSVKLPKEWPWLVVPMEVEADIGEANWFQKNPWVDRSGEWGPKG